MSSANIGKIDKNVNKILEEEEREKGKEREGKINKGEKQRGEVRREFKRIKGKGKKVIRIASINLRKGIDTKISQLKEVIEK